MPYTRERNEFNCINRRKFDENVIVRDREVFNIIYISNVPSVLKLVAVIQR